MSTPPPPYSSQPPPAYTRSRPQRKSRRAPRPPRPARPSSRELLTKALHRALHAVELDSSGSDLPAAIAAYDEAIALLQRVITFRSRHPGRASELERVTEIHDKYADRVRELCRNRRVPLPDHVPPTPVPNPAGCTPPPLPTTSPLRLPLPLPPCQDPAPSFSRPSNDVLLERLKLKRRSSPTDDETEWVPELSPSSSTSSALESLLPLPPTAPDDDREVDDEGCDDDDPLHWIWSAAREDELKEWGQYLEDADDDPRLSMVTASFVRSLEFDRPPARGVSTGVA